MRVGCLKPRFQGLSITSNFIFTRMNFLEELQFILPWYILRNQRPFFYVRRWLQMAIEQGLDAKLRAVRSERYLMQSVAKKALPDERVSTCLRLVTNSQNVQVWKHLKTQKAFYNGLMVCGSLWHCPICAAKISEKRRLELKQAFEYYETVEKGHIAFLTLTFKHVRSDSLKDILDKFTLASRKLKSGRAYQDIKNDMGIDGTIKGLEVTYSDANGFHPHSHEVIFYKNKCDLRKIKNRLWGLWINALNKFGLTAIKKRGITLQTGSDANDYMSKFGQGHWTLDREMTKAHIKKGKDKDSLTPFDFLKFYLDTDKIRYLKLFQEYAKVFKGKRQLVWSRGLKQKLLIVDKSDEQLATEKLEDADLLGLIDYEDWKLILKYDYRSKLLDLVEQFGYETGLKLIFNRINKLKKDISKDAI